VFGEIHENPILAVAVHLIFAVCRWDSGFKIHFTFSARCGENRSKYADVSEPCNYGVMKMDARADKI